MVIGQTDPHLPFNREPLELTAFFLDGSEETVEFRNAAQFIMAWKNLDHPNLISIVLLQKQTYTNRKKGLRNYRQLIFTNDSETTHYWLEKDGWEIQDGDSIDIPDGSSAFPKNERTSTIDIDNKAGGKHVPT